MASFPVLTMIDRLNGAGSAGSRLANRPDAARQADAFFRRAGIVIEPVTLEQGQLARQAFLDFGKGRHKAGLNFGDCFSYALAKATGEPLLFKGDDFARTDIEIVSS